MSEVTRNFIKASLLYLLVGVALGLVMALSTDLSLTLRASHAHINLLGWVSMLMFGVAYHIIPRFHGRLLHSEPLAAIHFWLANVGLVGLAVAFPLGIPVLTGIFGAVWAAAAFIFVYNLWKTMG